MGSFNSEDAQNRKFERKYRARDERNGGFGSIEIARIRWTACGTTEERITSDPRWNERCLL